MDAVFFSIFVSVIATLLATFLLKFNENFLPRIPRTRKARKLIGKLKKDYLIQFEPKRIGKTKFATRVQYYLRDHDPKAKEPPQLTFSFFAKEDFELEEFKAFLIPPLNRDKMRSDESSVEHLRSDITVEWKEYFHHIGRKAERSLQKTSISVAQRVVFFDRFLLDFFILERNLLLKYAGINKDEQDKLTVKTGEVAKSSQLVRYVIRNAYATVMIHEMNRGYNAGRPDQRPIDTYYYDKGHVKSTMYYDFGLYGIAGHTLVYLPIYRRGLDKRLVGEKVYIDETALQRAGISEFREDFNSLWEDCENQKHGEMKYRECLQPSKIELYSFSHDFFEHTYIHTIIEIFKEQFNWDLIAEKALPK
jgi:hypothetical protein